MEPRKKEPEPHRVDLGVLKGKNVLSKSWSLSRTRCFKKHSELFEFKPVVSGWISVLFLLSLLLRLIRPFGMLEIVDCFLIIWNNSRYSSDSSREIWLVSDSKCEITDHIWNLISPMSGPKSVLGVFWSTSGITLGEPNICYSHRQPSGEAIRWLDRTQFSPSIQKGQHSEQQRQGKSSLQKTFLAQILQWIQLQSHLRKQ